jgi:hypothetical protein
MDKTFKELLSNPAKIVDLIHTFISMGSKDVVENFLEQADLPRNGADFLTVSKNQY